jgi:hypothetical protein
MKAQSGTALVTGLLLLSLVTLLGLAGAAAAQVELQLARNEQFRENAASAASAGIEMAISQVTLSTPETIPARLYSSLPGDAARFEARTRFIGYEFGLPQVEGASLAAAHFEITGTGFAARNAAQSQRAMVVHVVALVGATGTACEPVVAGVPCTVAGELERLSWQRLP